MSEERSPLIVEEEVRFTLTELCVACNAEQMQLIELVEEGVLDPEGTEPEQWVFGGHAMRRARAALRLSRDLQLSFEATAVVMDLLDEIERLRARLRRVGLG